MRRVLVVAVLIAAFFAAAVPILSSAQGTTPGSANGASSAQTTAKRTTVDRGEVKLTTSATGKLVVNQQSNLSFDASGRLQEDLVTEGQQVKAGQVLARLDTS